MADKLLELSVEENFIDGDLCEQFEQLGYGRGEWKAYTIRRIPRALAVRVKNSGGKLIPPEDGMAEDVYRPTVPPVIIPEDEVIAEYRRRFDNEKPWLRVMFIGIGEGEGSTSETNWSDGNFREWFAALEMEPWLGYGEILTLPKSLINRVASSGAVFKAPDEMFDEQQYQHRFVVRREAFRDEVLAKRQADAERKALELKNAEILAQIEQHNIKFLEAERKGDRAVMRREQELLNTIYKTKALA